MWEDEYPDIDELEELWEMGMDYCDSCGNLYCSCCGCDCWFESDWGEEEYD